MMPAMDGYAVCERLKARPETAGIPVIFVTAMDDLTASPSRSAPQSCCSGSGPTSSSWPPTAGSKRTVRGHPRPRQAARKPRGHPQQASRLHLHFAHEEYYFRQLHACDEDGHELRHKEFASYIADAKLALVERDSVESTQLFYFLASWLMRHIRDEDRVLARFRHLLHDQGPALGNCREAN